MCFRPAAAASGGPVKCPKCGAYRLPYRLCKSCMTYNGREFGTVETTESKAN